MLKKHSQLFVTLMFAFDMCVVVAAWIGAYFIRFEYEIVPVTKGYPELAEYLRFTIFVILVWAISMRVAGLYDPMRGNTKTHELFRIFKASTSAVVLLMAVTFFYREYEFSRLAMVVFWCLSFSGVIVSHGIVRWILKFIRRRGYNLRHVLIVGAGNLASQLIEKIHRHPEMGLHIIGALGDQSEQVGSMVADVRVIGHVDEITKHIHETGADQIYVALPMNAPERFERVMNALGDEIVDVKIVPDLLHYIRLNGGVYELDGIPILSLSDSPLYGWNVVIKRLADILVSVIGIIVVSPIMLAIAALIKLTSTGPILYRQERMSLGGEKFVILKFRSMYIDAEKHTGPVWASENDDRRTPIGRFLRQTSLDELPQLFNVLMGYMSIVGPRPERPVLVNEFKKTVPLYMLRHKMKAGITGWAQVNGWRGNTSLEKRIEYDLYYIEHWSLMFDIKILFMTIWKGLVHRHAY